MNFRARLVILGLLFILGFIFILLRVLFIDLAPSLRDKLTYAKTDAVTFERGMIMDRNMNEMAVSIRQTSIAVDPQKITKNRMSDYGALCNILKIDVSEFRKAARSTGSFAWLKRKVDDTTVESVKKLNLEGIQFLSEYKRFYPNQNLCSHVLGCVGVDNYGLEGIEHYFDNELKGNNEDTEFQKPDSRRSLFRVVEGKTVVLTIDKVIQHIVEKDLLKTYKDMAAESVTAIVMDPRNGEILAMANLPDFDPNSFNLFSSLTLKNLAVSDFYEPGSIFKIISTAAVIKSGLLPLNESFNCPGYIKIGSKRIRCWKTHGRLVYDDMLKYSCNVGVINRTLLVDPKVFFNMVRDFGFGNVTGVELPGEMKGLVRPFTKWTLFSRAGISIGQEIGVTPLQLITAVATVANGGKLFQPHIVREIDYANGVIYKGYPPLVVRDVIPGAIADELNDLLVRVTTKGGTGEKAALKGFEVAGKSGTAQVFDKVHNTYYADKHVLSFIGYYPAKRPAFIILVIVRNPRIQTDLTGGLVAAPVFHEIALKINSYCNFVSDANVIPVPGGEPKYGDPKENKKNYSLESMPDLRGVNMKQCLEILKDMDLTPNFIGSGIAWKQYPPPGSKVDHRMPITVYFK